MKPYQIVTVNQMSLLSSCVGYLSNKQFELGKKKIERKRKRVITNYNNNRIIILTKIYFQLNSQ